MGKYNYGENPWVGMKQMQSIAFLLRSLARPECAAELIQTHLNLTDVGGIANT